MITTQLRNLLLAVVCIFAGVSAQAQFTGGVDQYPTSGYEGSPIEFTLSEVATALGTDAATLGAAINEYVTAEAPTTVLFAANGTNWNAEIEAANHGFWMALDGTPVGYGETSVWYCSPEVDEAFTTLTFNVGQMPNVMNVGDKGETTITLKFNDNQVTFALSLNVIAKPEFNVPEPTLIEKNLQIVGQQEVVVEQYPRGGYDADPVKVYVGEALTLLGITDKAAMAENINKVVYTTWYNDGDVEQGGGMKRDSLTNTPTGEGHGFWFRAVQNANGEEDGEVAASGYNAIDKFYMNNFTYIADNDSLTCVLGQYPGVCKDNEQWFANVYIIYGEKAYKIKYTLKLLEKAQGNGVADMEKVGEGSVVVEQEPTNDYSTSVINPDLEAIAALLGCTVDNMDYYALDDKDNFAEKTAGSGRGFWFSAAGTVMSWGKGCAFFVEPTDGTDLSSLNVGQYPDAMTAVGDEASANLYFISGTKYYQYTVTLKIVEPQMVEYNFENVDTRSFTVQAIPSATEYPVGDLITISAESIEAAIGTATPTLYGLAPDSVAAVTGTYSTKYSCDPKPGFWLAKDGRVSTWGGESPVGICWVDNSILRFFQFPNANSYGDSFTTQLFLVNEETNKMITLNITLNFVETLEQKEEVGTASVVLPVNEETNVEVDLAAVATALGVTVDDLLSSSNYYLHGLTSAGAYGEGQNCENGLGFDADGGYSSYGSIYLTIGKEGDKTFITIGSNDPVADDFNVSAQFCFEVDNKQYVFYAKLCSPSQAQGVSSIAADKNDAQIYDLTGRKVLNAKRGLYIQNGRKYIVK